MKYTEGMWQILSFYLDLFYMLDKPLKNKNKIKKILFFFFERASSFKATEVGVALTTAIRLAQFYLPSSGVNKSKATLK